MGNEENSNKIAKENEELKQKILSLNQEMHKNSLTQPSNSSVNVNTIIKQNGLGSLNDKNPKQVEVNNTNQTNKLKDHYDDLNPDFKISQINSHRVSVEYLKNVLLKYLEAIAIGNEFQIKILENVIFSILRIPNSERLKLEDKRNRSSFYLNLWYNAKAYLAAKIYGNPYDAENLDNSGNAESLNFEMDKNFIAAIQGNNSNINGEIIDADKNISGAKDEGKINNIDVVDKTKDKISELNNKTLDKDLTGEDLDIDI